MSLPRVATLSTSLLLPVEMAEMASGVRAVVVRLVTCSRGRLPPVRQLTQPLSVLRVSL